MRKIYGKIRPQKKKKSKGNNLGKLTSSFRFFSAIAFFATAILYCSSKEYQQNQPIINLGSEAHQEVPRDKPEEEMPALNFKTAFFDFDKAVLRSDGKKALKPTADWLKKNPNVSVQIEGYCDELGSQQYNLILGAKRAEAAKAFLVSQGVKPESIMTISYGRVEGESEEVRAQNRRAGIVVIFPRQPGE